MEASMGVRVGLTYDLKSDYTPKKGEPKDISAEFDHGATINALSKALTSAGYKVVRIGNARNLLSSLSGLEVDIVFNIAEGLQGRNRESQVPILLEMQGVPFVGSDALTLGITLDKIIAKKMFIAHNIPTPKFINVYNPCEIDGISIKFPAIVKPRFEGSSKGINDNSIVRDRETLLRQSQWLIDTYKQPALVEEFIEGKEFTVVILGNTDAKALPVVQICIDGNLELGNSFYTFSRIHSTTLDYICPAQISKDLEEKIKKVALDAYYAVECRDFGRVDIRLDAQEQPYVLEVNPLPSLSTVDVFPVVAKAIGTSYDDLIVEILRHGLKRYGFNF
jgi:D-alanine-D-alanine ligase